MANINKGLADDLKARKRSLAYGTGIAVAPTGDDDGNPAAAAKASTTEQQPKMKRR